MKTLLTTLAFFCMCALAIPSLHAQSDQSEATMGIAPQVTQTDGAAVPATESIKQTSTAEVTSRLSGRVDYSSLVQNLISAIQDQQEIINQHKVVEAAYQEEIDQLKEDNRALLFQLEKLEYELEATSALLEHVKKGK
ncbi:MAG: hypothetical protein AAGI38_12690 [Bacteroidota bacterium]